MLTTRSSTGTTSKRISPPAWPCSRTSLVDGPALGIQEHPPTDRAIRQKRKTKSFITAGVINQRGKSSQIRILAPNPWSILGVPRQAIVLYRNVARRRRQPAA